MSTSAHCAISLVWDGSRGWIACNGLHMTLWEQPHVPGLAKWGEIVFRPRMADHRIMRRGHWADLAPAERYAIEAWLRRWSSNSRASIVPWDGKTERRGGGAGRDAAVSGTGVRA